MLGLDQKKLSAPDGICRSGALLAAPTLSTISRFIRRFIQILGMRVRGRQEQSDRIQTRYKPVIACGDGALRGRLENTLNYQEL